MKLTRYLLGICLLVCSMEGSAFDKNTRKGMNWSESCAAYSKAYTIHINANPPEGMVHPKFAKKHNFIVGFLSAVNMWVETGLEDIRRGHSWETVHLYVEKHCRDNPLDDVSDALYSFVLEMERK